MPKSVSTALCAAALLTAGGCTTTSGRPDVVLGPLRGQPIDRVVAAWGPPTTAGEAAGVQAFTWRFTRLLPWGETGACAVNVSARDGLVTGYRYSMPGCIFRNPKTGYY